MADMILFDKLAYIDRLKRAATKADLRIEITGLENKIESEITRLENKIESEITRLENKIGSEITRLENKIGSDITRLESKIGSESARLDTKIDVAARDVTIRIGAMLIALFAALASIKFFG
jgi:hypothetical protein